MLRFMAFVEPKGVDLLLLYKEQAKQIHVCLTDNLKRIEELAIERYRSQIPDINSNILVLQWFHTDYQKYIDLDEVNWSEYQSTVLQSLFSDSPPKRSDRAWTLKIIVTTETTVSATVEETETFGRLYNDIVYPLTKNGAPINDNTEITTHLWPLWFMDVNDGNNDNCISCQHESTDTIPVAYRYAQEVINC
ncbi:unnamed protein product, partial [Didymodactylos carnosus]